MNQPRNINRTGKVTISRKNDLPMNRSVWIRFGLWFAGTALFFLVLIVFSEGVEDPLMLLFPLVIGIVVGGLFKTLPNLGTKVESVSFDYDNRQVVVNHTNMRNHKFEIVIPFDEFHFRSKESHSGVGLEFEMGARVKFYRHYERMAVLVFDHYGWDEGQQKRIEKELKGFFIDHKI